MEHSFYNLNLIYMNQVVKQFITHALSGEDILNICNGEANLVPVSKLDQYKNIDEVLGEYGACILLYDKKNGDAGHWSCIFKVTNRMLEFFCPYGLQPDDSIDVTGGKPYLSYLLVKSGYLITYNHYQLQKYSKSVNVCGRYVGLRLQLRNWPLNKFINMLTKNKSYTSDFWVTVLTLFCEN